MKTTIDVPEELLHRVKVFAAERQTTLKELVIAGLDWVLRSESAVDRRAKALRCLHQGFHLGGTPLSRQEANERR